MEQPSPSLNTDTIELIVKQGIFKNKLVIDRFGIEFKKRQVLFSQIESLRYGVTNVYVNGIKSNVSYTYDFLDSNHKKFRVFFSAIAFSKKSKQEAADNNSVIENILWKHLTHKIVNTMIQTLNSNGTVKVGNFEAGRNGIKISYWKFIFLKREAFLPWKDCMKGLGPGYFYIQSATNKSIKAKSMFLTTWNLNAFHYLINYLWDNSNCYRLERGERI